MAETEHLNIHSKLLGQILTFSGPRNQKSLLIFQLLEKVDQSSNPPPRVPWRSVNKSYPRNINRKNDICLRKSSECLRLPHDLVLQPGPPGPPSPFLFLLFSFLLLCCFLTSFYLPPFLSFILSTF